MNQPKETELILALDCEDKSKALKILRDLRGNLLWVKIGLQMFTAEGLALVDTIHAMGFKIFLDLKLHDIPNTVAKSIQSLSKSPIDMITIHALGGHEMCLYAVEARNLYSPNLRLLAVTILTSMNQDQMHSMNIVAELKTQVLDLAKLSLSTGIDGVVSSPQELGVLRKNIGEDPLIVCPGIRPKGSSYDEQKRVMSPHEACSMGADFIVVGRPILMSDKPIDIVKSIYSSLGHE
mgnify:CR=1 FL=1